MLPHNLPKYIHFVSTVELENMYPNLTRKEREDEIIRKYKAVFLYQIGYPLADGMPHDTRAADYDDWMLNGDILVHYELYDMALELSSMGIRVDAKSLVTQLNHKNENDKLTNDYCISILKDEIPLTIGGGIGQSRLCMFMLQKAHIGEVQVSIWPEEQINRLKKNNIELL
jgi:aspartate--ammonia ligase